MPGSLIALLNPWVILSVVLALGGSYAWGRHDGAKSASADKLEQAAVLAKVTEAAQKGAAGEIAKLTIQHVTIQRQVERTIREVPVYRDCKHVDSVVRDVNSALANRPVTPGN